jgi:hypothetical protein
MCGKPNPAENEVCQFCQARIKPLIIQPPSDDATAERSNISPDTPRLGKSSKDEPQAPDWLQPDWLQSLRQEEGLSEFSESQAREWDENGAAEPGWTDASAENEAVPEWLKRVRQRRSAEEAIESEPPEEGPDFMDQLRAQRYLGETEPLPGIPSEGEPALPSWLAGLGAESDQENPPPLPEWLKSEEVVDISQETTRPVSPAAEPFPEEEGIPDWLKVLQEKSAVDEGVFPVAPQVVEEEPQEAHIEEEAPPLEEPRIVAPFTFDEETAELLGEDLEALPDWLKETQPGEVEEEAPEPPAGVDLAPGSLPTWLEMMRPVEAAAPSAPQLDERERLVEGSGPLAGLRGVLPAEAEVSGVKKPPAFAVKLQVSESQQLHASLLSDLLKAEGVVPPLPARRVVSAQNLLRPLVFIALLIPIVWQLAYGGIASPTLAPSAEIIDTRNVVNALSGGEPVLIAVDYEPGLSGEMDAAAASVLDHLMLKGAYLTLVSTVPTGPAQAERLVRMVSERGGHRYQSLDQYTNLGYIPGGISGLRGFAEAPQQVVPYALDGGSIWTSGKLSGVHKLSDFALTLVITESPESARAWIEQVRPGLGDRPLLMVVSAQAEPQVRPYYEGHPSQVQGVVIGLAGGVSYEALPRNNPGRQYWDAYSLGLSAAIVLIILGGLINLVAFSASSARQPLPKG